MEDILFNGIPPEKFQTNHLLALEALPNADLVYNIKDALLYRVWDEQGPHLPVHIFEMANLPNGDSILWSHHQQKFTSLGDGKFHVVTPEVKGGLRQNWCETMEHLMKNSVNAWKDYGILNITVVEDKPELKGWYISNRK